MEKKKQLLIIKTPPAVTSNSMPTLATSRGPLINMNYMLSWQKKHCFWFLPFLTKTSFHRSQTWELASTIWYQAHGVQIYNMWSTGESVLSGLGWRDLKTATSVCQLSHMAGKLPIHRTKRVFYISKHLF